ncbi:hypothetical protein H5410_060364 [Solanum commersonii]|uniref:DUF7745 domain-containing protein n=1 Tax=Solanum commersonii TaxID=4109 RepID=A0A9J5W6B9_SOLCO|nr:hypothetical protein H5410_060364 [Solanum commersonii]
MGDYEQRRVKYHLGHLVHLMKIYPRRIVIDALSPFWDPKNNMFQFSNFELTPTLEEIASFIGKGSSIWGVDLHRKRLVIPKSVDGNKFILDWSNHVSTHKERVAQRLPTLCPALGYAHGGPHRTSTFSFDSGDILNISFGSIISEKKEMVVEKDKGKVQKLVVVDALRDYRSFVMGDQRPKY